MRVEFNGTTPSDSDASPDAPGHGQAPADQDRAQQPEQQQTDQDARLTVG